MVDVPTREHKDSNLNGAGFLNRFPVPYSTKRSAVIPVLPYSLEDTPMFTYSTRVQRARTFTLHSFRLFQYRNKY